MSNVFELNNIIDYIWFIPIFLSIHEIEEWNILKWYQKNYINFPNSTNFSIRLHIVTFCIMSFLLTLVAYLFQGALIFSIIIAFLLAFIALNTIQHIIWTFQTRTYSIGLITAIICLMISMYVNILLIRNGAMDAIFYVIFVLIITPVIETIKTKNEMTKEVRNVHNFFIKAESHIKSVFKK